MRDDTEQKAFCLLGMGRDGTQPGLGGDGESAGPQKGLVSAGRHGCWAGETWAGKPSLQQQSELQTPFTFILTHLDSSLCQRLLCSLLLTKPGP